MSNEKFVKKLKDILKAKATSKEGKVLAQELLDAIEEQAKKTEELFKRLDKFEKESKEKCDFTVSKVKGPKILVDIIESERGWGQKIDETKEFDSLEEAKAFISKYNSKNNKPTVPDWYMYAELRNRY